MTTLSLRLLAATKPPPTANGDNCSGDFRFHRQFRLHWPLPSSWRGSGAFYAPQGALQPLAEDRQWRMIAELPTF